MLLIVMAEAVLR